MCERAFFSVAFFDDDYDLNQLPSCCLISGDPDYCDYDDRVTGCEK